MTTIGNLARLAQTGQALAVAGKGINLAKKKKAKLKDFVETGTTTMVGTSLIRAQGQLAAGL